MSIISPLDLFFAAFEKADCLLMKGVEDSPLVSTVCSYLYDMRLEALERRKNSICNDIQDLIELGIEISFKKERTNMKRHGDTDGDQE